VGRLQIGENLAISRQQNYGGIDDQNLGENNIVGKNILMQRSCRCTTSQATSRPGSSWAAATTPIR